MTDPPYAIRTERLLLRCWEPRDAPLLKEAVDSSLDHLRPWMPWAWDDPQPLEQKVQLLRRFRGEFDLGQSFVYGILAPDESEAIGGTGLHLGVGPEAVEIGYWIRASHVGRGYATEATAVLTRVAFELCEADRVELHVEPRNGASAAVPRKLGFREEATLRRRLRGRDGEPLRDMVVFTLLREELADSGCADATFEAYGAAGTRVA